MLSTNETQHSTLRDNTLLPQDYSDSDNYIDINEDIDFSDTSLDSYQDPSRAWSMELETDDSSPNLPQKVKKLKKRTPTPRKLLRKWDPMIYYSLTDGEVP